jgi:hypothetical protein
LKIEATKVGTGPTLEDSFRNTVAGDSIFAEKMCLWRGAVELRRAHKVHSTDLIIRALIDSAGDLSRAVVLLGTKDYALLNNSGISAKLRKLFLPTIEGNSQPQSHKELLMSSIRKTLSFDMNGIDDNDNIRNGMSFKQNNVNVIRSLRGLKGKQIVYEQSREEKRTELFNILNSVVECAYLSKNHNGAKDHRKNQKIPHNATQKSRTWLEKQNEQMLSQTLDYLIPKPLKVREANL